MARTYEETIRETAAHRGYEVAEVEGGLAISVPDDPRYAAFHRLGGEAERRFDTRADDSEKQKPGRWVGTNSGHLWRPWSSPWRDH